MGAPSPFASSGCVSGQPLTPGSCFMHVLFLLPLAQCTLPPNQPSLSLVCDVTSSFNNLWATWTQETKLSPVCLCGRNPECACHREKSAASHPGNPSTQLPPDFACDHPATRLAPTSKLSPPVKKPQTSWSETTLFPRPRGRVGHWPPAIPSCRAHVRLAASLHMPLSTCIISPRTVHLITGTTSTHHIQDAVLLSAGLSLNASLWPGETPAQNTSQEVLEVDKWQMGSPGSR